MNLEQRVALVMGSTSDIRAEIARRLGEAGVRVVVTGRDGDRGQEIVGEITGAGGEAYFVAHDLEDVDGSSRLVEETVEAFGRIDTLDNNGGTLMAAPTPEVDVETFGWAFRLNVRSAFFLTRAAVPRMTEQGWGRVINISSFVGQLGRPGLALYGATKAALEQLTRAWAVEFAPYGVAVNCIAPGPISTPFTKKNLGFADPEPSKAREAEMHLSSKLELRTAFFVHSSSLLNDLCQGLSRGGPFLRPSKSPTARTTRKMSTMPKGFGTKAWMPNAARPDPPESSASSVNTAKTPATSRV